MDHHGCKSINVHFTYSEFPENGSLSYQCTQGHRRIVFIKRVYSKGTVSGPTRYLMTNAKNGAFVYQTEIKEFQLYWFIKNCISDLYPYTYVVHTFRVFPENGTLSYVPFVLICNN